MKIFLKPTFTEPLRCKALSKHTVFPAYHPIKVKVNKKLFEDLNKFFIIASAKYRTKFSMVVFFTTKAYFLSF